MISKDLCPEPRHIYRCWWLPNQYALLSLQILQENEYIGCLDVLINQFNQYNTEPEFDGQIIELPSPEHVIYRLLCSVKILNKY